MENAPVIRIVARRFQPEYEERQLKWFLEAYAPLFITVPGYEEIEHYHIFKENPQYNKNLTIYHFENWSQQLKTRSDQRVKDISKDVETTWASRSETVWYVHYAQIASFKKDLTNPGGNSVPESKNSRIIHLEGYTFPNPEQETFDTWFNKLGKELFIPLLMKSTDLREYAQYRLIEDTWKGVGDVYRTKRPVEYPTYLSILTFDNINSFENYEKSLELAAFRYALNLTFPGVLDYKWYVQYQLIKSFRK